MKVKFSGVDDWIAELDAELTDVRRGTAIEHRIVDGIARVCCVRIPSKLSPNIWHVTVVAGYRPTKRPDEIVELAVYLGDDWGADFKKPDEKSAGERANELIERLVGELAERELQRRGGTFE